MCQSDEVLSMRESEALESDFGSELQRKIVLEERQKGIRVRDGGRIRQEYVHRFEVTLSMASRAVLVGA